MCRLQPFLLQTRNRISFLLSKPSITLCKVDECSSRKEYCHYGLRHSVQRVTSWIGEYVKLKRESNHTFRCKIRRRCKKLAQDVDLCQSNFQMILCYKFTNLIAKIHRENSQLLLRVCRIMCK